MLDLINRDVRLLVRAMLRAYHRTVPNRTLSIAVTTTAAAVPEETINTFRGRYVRLRAVTANVEVLRASSGRLATTGGLLLIAGLPGEDFFVRDREQWAVVGSASGSLLVAWSSDDGMPLEIDRYGT